MAILRWRPVGQSVEQWDPFREITEMQHDMNRAFNGFFGRGGMTPDRPWAPGMDMWETKDELVVSLDVPGVNEANVHVTITGDVLTVRGERLPADVKPESAYLGERWFGKFERAVTLPYPVQADRVTASYRDGVLTIHLPKVEEIKPKEIKIDVL